MNGEGDFSRCSGSAGLSMLVPETGPRPTQTRRSGQVVASNRQRGDGPRQAIALQHAHLPPEKHSRERHHDEDLEQDPNVDAGKYVVERDDMRVGKSQTYRLIDDGGEQEEQRNIARQFVPTLFGVVEGAAERKAEEALARTQPPP